MATKKAATAVAVQQPSEVAVFADDRPDYLKNQTGPARGSEEVGQDDRVIPRLEIVQAQSPIKEADPEARDGMLFNSATQEVYGEQVYVIPVFFRKEWLVWKDQDEGGGFFGSFPNEASGRARIAEEIGKDESLDGETERGRPILDCIDTPVHFCLLVNPDDPAMCQQIVVSMAKTKAKVSRKWNSMVELFGGDRFSRVYKLTTFTDENKKGQKFKNFVVSNAGYPPEHLYTQAVKLYELIKAGGIRAGHEQVVDNDEGAPAGRGEI